MGRRVAVGVVVVVVVGVAVVVGVVVGVVVAVGVVVVVVVGVAVAVAVAVGVGVVMFKDDDKICAWVQQLKAGDRVAIENEHRFGNHRAHYTRGFVARVNGAHGGTLFIKTSWLPEAIETRYDLRGHERNGRYDGRRLVPPSQEIEDQREAERLERNIDEVKWDTQPLGILRAVWDVVKKGEEKT